MDLVVVVMAEVLMVRLGSPVNSAGDLSWPCRRVLRRAINFFLVSICFLRARRLFPLARYWLI